MKISYKLKMLDRYFISILSALTIHLKLTTNEVQRNISVFHCFIVRPATKKKIPKMAKLSISSLLIMLYVHYCFGLPTADEMYFEDEVCNARFGF